MDELIRQFIKDANIIHIIILHDDDAKRCKAATKPLRPDDNKRHNMCGCYSISIFPTETYKTGRCVLKSTNEYKDNHFVRIRQALLVPT